MDVNEIWVNRQGTHLHQMTPEQLTHNLEILGHMLREHRRMKLVLTGLMVMHTWVNRRLQLRGAARGGELDAHEMILSDSIAAKIARQIRQIEHHRIVLQTFLRMVLRTRDLDLGSIEMLGTPLLLLLERHQLELRRPVRPIARQLLLFQRLRQLRPSPLLRQDHAFTCPVVIDRATHCLRQ